MLFQEVSSDAMKTFWILEETREGGKEDNGAYYTASLPALCPEDGLRVIGTGSSKREAFSRLAWNLKVRESAPATVSEARECHVSGLQLLNVHVAASSF